MAKLTKYYFALMFLFDMCEQSRIGKIPLATGTPKFPFGLLLILNNLVVVACTLFLAHYFYNSSDSI